MKLSIAVPIFRRTEEINSFFERMIKQDSKEFEMVVIIDTNANDQFSKVIPWVKKFGDRCKLIFNTKRRGYSKSIATAFRSSRGEYVWTITTSDKVKAITGVKDLIRDIEKSNNPDVLEFPLQFRGVIRWNPDLRIQSTKATLVSNKPDFIAKTMPTIFNKVFKKDLVISALKLKPYKEMNSRFVFEILYISLLRKDISFSTTKNHVTKTYIDKNSNSFNPSRLMAQWKSIFTICDLYENHYHDELYYASLYHQTVMIGKFTVNYKTKVMFEKYWKMLLHFYEKTSDNKESNKYILSNTIESNLISSIKTKAELKKALKEL